jgi:hypothetical protein
MHDAGSYDVRADVRDAGRDVRDGTSPPDAFFDAGNFVLTAIGIDGDHVSRGDLGLSPDGEPDGEFRLTSNMPLDALILVTVDEGGNPCCGQQWDTLTNNDPIPQSLGFSFTIGASTWVLGVWQNQKLNDGVGHVALSPGSYTLYGADSSYFNSDQRFRAYGRTNGSWIASNVAVWP